MVISLKKFIKSNWYIVSFIVIVVVAAFLRFYKFADVPHGMTWDEAAIGYNGYSVITTRRDEWLTFLPISFRSFGDYKAPFAIYLTGLFTAVLGLELWVVRLPFILSGVLAVVGSILLARKLFSGSQYVSIASILTGFLLAVSPWHFHFTRTGFESGMALTMVIWGVFTFLHAWDTHGKKRILLLSSGICLLVLSLYTYHSTKVSAPILGLFLLWYTRDKVTVFWKQLLFPVVSGVALGIPLCIDLFFRNGLERAGVTVFAQGNDFLSAVGITIRQLILHLTPAFLLFGETTTLRHGDGLHGVLYPTTALFAFGVLVWLSINWIQQKKLPMYTQNVAVVSVVLVGLGLLPAAIATEVPHSNRGLLAVTGFILLAVLGLVELLRFAASQKNLKSMRDSKNRKTIFFQLIIGTFILIHSLFAIEYFSYYFKTFAQESADAFKDGYIEMFEYVRRYEKGTGGVHEAQNILITSEYGQPYIYALFVRQTNPIYYHGGSLIKYIFHDSFQEGDLLRDNTIIVSSPNDVMPFDKAEYTVVGSDGKPRFYIFDTTKVK